MNAARDPLKRRALQTMIETYGQTPRKLFNMPHVQRFSKVLVSPLTDMMPSLPQAVENLMGASATRERFQSKFDIERSDEITLRSVYQIGLFCLFNVIYMLTALAVYEGLDPI